MKHFVRSAAAAGLLALLALLAQAKVTLGADVLVAERLDLLRGKRVGLVTNHTGRLSSGDFLLDVLLRRHISVVALFAPEHGVRGQAAAGELVEDSVDSKTGIPVFSLYGRTRRPTAEMLRNIDILVYDIQDVGARFYTYLSTMALTMYAAAEKGIPYVVLDRPNPLGGIMIDGPLLEDSLRSFVGMFKIPVVYGLTCGELAQMINGERWLPSGIQVNLTVVPMQRWKRKMLWIDTGLPWHRPSPNIPTAASALVYPSTCIIEATNCSEGRGTTKPFQTIGAPFIDGETLSRSLQRCDLPGVSFRSVTFTPTSSKFSGKECHGVLITVTDARRFEPARTGLHILQEIQRLYTSHLIVDRKSFGRLFGRAQAYDALLRGDSPESMEATWKPDLGQYRTLTTRYLLYVND